MGLLLPSYRASDFDVTADYEGLADGSAPHAPGWSIDIGKLGFVARRFLMLHWARHSQEPQSAIAGRISQVHRLTLPLDERERLGLPRSATHFAFAYPASTEREMHITSLDVGVADIAFVVYGGFMYFDSDMGLQAVRAVAPAENGALSALRFGTPRRLAPAAAAALAGRPWGRAPPTAARAAGATHVAWLAPGVDGELTQDGGFVYLFHDPGELGAPQARPGVYVPVEVPPRGAPCTRCCRPLQWSDSDRGARADGWSCKHFQSCGQCAASAGAHRWTCPECAVDVCGGCLSPPAGWGAAVGRPGTHPRRSGFAGRRRRAAHR